VIPGLFNGQKSRHFDVKAVEAGAAGVLKTMQGQTARLYDHYWAAG